MSNIKICLLFIGIAVGLVLALVSNHRTTARQQKIISKYGQGTFELEKNFGKTLVIYYSMSGNTEIVANLIAEKTHADIYRIKSSRKYNVFSALVGKFVVDLKDLPNLASYNTVFVGGPVWAYSMPSPLVFFLKNTDLGGKNVVSFSTNGGGVGKFHDKFRESARNAKILGTMDFYRVKNMGNLVLKNMLLDLLNTVGN